ncbi:glycoside hydrolase 5 family protein [Streptomyces rugosispiralis]|uniref:Glycoside hydrolase family 5 protein n=1 Tax=Streptomyces rugosispiralis TaxID=2967341 RepID=A0ABT1V6I1_9ACTN|nr:cellulase family glycosylhydrolase [Streptomyces rugosispiralis]MCQ8192628.1 glycoside hydrolase family 5 protein [Streptomyces rugosispiralis]
MSTPRSAIEAVFPRPAGTPRFGVNYVPSRGWWYSWLDWEPSAMAADLRAVADLGMDHIRIHCLWPVFQANPGHISGTALARLHSLLDLADECGLDVSVTVLNGWLSGFYFRPAWQHGVNLFTDPVAVAAQLDLLAAMAERIAAHPRFLGFDIANEPNVLAHYAGNDITTSEGDAWTRRLLNHCEAIAPGRMHVAGFDHEPWLTDSAPFSREILARTGSATPLHAWIEFTGALKRYGYPSTATHHLGEYLLELAKAFQSDPHRPLWLQEFGAAPQWISEDAVAEFTESFTAAALSCDQLWGVTWWASHDIDRGLAGFADLEYDLGLLTTENQVKPAGRRLATLIDRLRQQPPTPATRTTALLLDDTRAPDWTFAERFFSLVDEGVRPAIVRASHQDDAEHIAERGITKILDL